jgi:hypothetical protein
MTVRSRASHAAAASATHADTSDSDAWNSTSVIAPDFPL